MKNLLILVAALAVVSAKSADIDTFQARPIESIGIKWSQVRPIEDTDQYWARVPADLQYLRKQQPDRRIVNGQEATPGQFPYQAFLEVQRVAGDWVCGGTIVNSNFILTTAYCVNRATGGTAIVGAHNHNITEPTQQKIPFSVVYYHADFNESPRRNDVAMVRLSRPITFNDRVRAVRLPPPLDNRPFAGLTGTVSGFGYTTATGGASNVLRFTTNTILSHADCLSAWGNSNEIQTSNLCLATTGQRTSCAGDVGGPLTVIDEGSPMLVGIVSTWHSSGCTASQPAVYARVTYFMDWIRHVMIM